MQSYSDVIQNARGDALSAPNMFGDSQSWQDMSGSRSIGGGPYTNSTGKPIQVYVSATITGSGSSSTLEVTVGGVAIMHEVRYAGTPNYINSVNFIVPPGDTYSVTGSAGSGSLVLNKWSELR